MDPMLVVMVFVQATFVAIMTILVLDYRRAKADREASASSLTTQELRQLIEEAIENATVSLQEQLQENEERLIRLQEHVDKEERLLEAPRAQ